MVRHIHKVVLPTSGGTMKVSTMKHIKGRGNGSVLLNGGIGGPGGGSSYTSVDDYMNTTMSGNSQGRGLASMNTKLENLLVKNKKPTKKEKNITFH